MVSPIQSVKAEVLPMATRLSLHIIPYFLSFQLLLLSPSLTAAAAAASVVSDFVRPHRWQPTRLPHPWDSPGKNTGVGCHFLLQCVKVKSLSHVQLLAPHGLQPTKLLSPWDFLGKSTGVGCHCLLRHRLLLSIYSSHSALFCCSSNTCHPRVFVLTISSTKIFFIKV